MVDPIEESKEVENLSNNLGYNLGTVGIGLMTGLEGLHMSKLNNIDAKHNEISHKLGLVKDRLKELYKHIKEETASVDFSHAKEQVLELWNEWKAEMEASKNASYKDTLKDLDQLDFSNLTQDNIDKELIPELEKVQRHLDYKFGKVPLELKMHLEMFDILIQILKEIPKKHEEMIATTNRNMSR